MEQNPEEDSIDRKDACDCVCEWGGVSAGGDLEGGVRKIIQILIGIATLSPEKRAMLLNILNLV